MNLIVMFYFNRAHKNSSPLHTKQECIIPDPLPFIRIRYFWRIRTIFSSAQPITYGHKYRNICGPSLHSSLDPINTSFLALTLRHKLPSPTVSASLATLDICGREKKTGSAEMTLICSSLLYLTSS